MRQSQQSAVIVNNSSEVANKPLIYSVKPFLRAFRADVSNGNGKKTHAFGRNKRIAKKNALKIYHLKYNTANFYL